ncbi:MAG: hypothetical protein LQ338_002343 [Usnochroma carphineum]|nr:MAG: hypothetical protein LQ338_002343 [Usnochroma carphineum]
MEHISTERFEQYNARDSNAVSHKSTSRLASFRPRDFPIQSVEHEYDETGSAPHSSGPDEAVFDPPLSYHSSPRTSHNSDEDGTVSSPFSESPYTPQEMPFRNPSSVRAMQLETTPPPYIPSSSLHRRNPSPTSSHRGTPRSTRSSHRGSRISPSKMSPTKRTNVKKEYPLVLLHVTLLPIPQLYSTEIMEQVLPSYILENWKILRKKATDTVLERGILIPHPKEDYDLMEERLLESLDLKTPRILKCGHFHLDPDEEADAAGSDSEDFDDEDNDADICADCGRRVRDGRYGSGTGIPRWDIKVYAANGLMRAGAWGAAWREMERVDVEITPWMDEDMKRELAFRGEEEGKHAALLQEEAVGRGGPAPMMDKERMREIYGDDIPAFGAEEEEQRSSPQPTKPICRQQNEIPLQDLLKNFLLTAARDRKNIAIILLSIFVFYLSLTSRPAPPATPATSHHPPFYQSSSNSVPVPTDTLVTGANGMPPSMESSATEPLAATTTAAAQEEKSAEDLSSASLGHSAEQEPTDWIEARFEFADG